MPIPSPKWEGFARRQQTSLAFPTLSSVRTGLADSATATSICGDSIEDGLGTHPSRLFP